MMLYQAEQYIKKEWIIVNRVSNKPLSDKYGMIIVYKEDMAKELARAFNVPAGVKAE